MGFLRKWWAVFFISLYLLTTPFGVLADEVIDAAKIQADAARYAGHEQALATLDAASATFWGGAMVLLAASASILYARYERYALKRDKEKNFVRELYVFTMLSASDAEPIKRNMLLRRAQCNSMRAKLKQDINPFGSLSHEDVVRQWGCITWKIERQDYNFVAEFPDGVLQTMNEATELRDKLNEALTLACLAAKVGNYGVADHHMETVDLSFRDLAVLVGMLIMELRRFMKTLPTIDRIITRKAIRKFTQPN